MTPPPPLCTWSRVTLIFFVILFLLTNFVSHTNSPHLRTISTTSNRNKHRELLFLLSTFDRQATQHHIQYRIEFGSLLGWVRSGGIIPHDSDIDILIDPSSLQILDQLTISSDESSSWYINAQSHSPLLPHPYPNPHLNATLSSSAYLHRLNHDQDFKTVQRTNCAGRKVNNMADACSFSGPVSRMIYFGSKNRTMSYIDVYISGCSWHKPFGKYKSWHCRTATRTCSFCPSKEAKHDSLLDQSGGGEELQRCIFSGVETWCPKSKSWSRSYLSKIYGGSWETPKSDWKYSDRPSKKRRL